MTRRQRDVFAEIPHVINNGINPFVSELLENRESQSHPCLYGNDLKDMAGNWRSWHHKRRPDSPEANRLVVEIGCHKGKCLAEMAENHPEDLFVGLDITFKRVVCTAKRSHPGISLASLLADARHLNQVFENDEIDGFVCFFPDPWKKKKRQAHHRLLTEDLLNQMSQLVRPGGFFWFKTDHKPYFDDVIGYASETPWKIAEEGCWLNSNEYTTVFEAGFAQQGLPTYQAVWKNC